MISGMDTLGEISKFVGTGSAGLGALWLILKYRPWKTANGNGHAQSIQAMVPFWRETIREIISNVLEEHEPKRNEKTREIIREELETFFRRGTR